MDPPAPLGLTQGLAEGYLLAGKYRILRLLGRGGMAEVYAAQHEILHQTVALKILLPEIAAIPGAAARFLNEARSAARIRSEHVATVMDVGMRDDGSAYIVLEYLEGEELQALIHRRGPLPPAEAVDYVIQALEALAHAHALGIVHRDLKPSNIFLARGAGRTTIVKVFDFGISKAPRTPEQADESSTASQMILGTPAYMAPEQARNAKDVDARTDIWALGVTLYRLLTGTMPFGGESSADVLAAILIHSPKAMREIRPSLSVDLDAVVIRCLEKERTKRFSNVAELATALAPHASADGRRGVDRVARALGLSEPPETVAGPRSFPLPPVPTLPVAESSPRATDPLAATEAVAASHVSDAGATRVEPNAPSTMMEASVAKRPSASPSRKALGGTAVAVVLVAIAIAARTFIHPADVRLHAAAANGEPPSATLALPPQVPSSPTPPQSADTPVATTTAIPASASVGSASETTARVDGGAAVPAAAMANASPDPASKHAPTVARPASEGNAATKKTAHDAGVAPRASASAKAYDILDQRN